MPVSHELQGSRHRSDQSSDDMRGSCCHDHHMCVCLHVATRWRLMTSVSDRSHPLTRGIDSSVIVTMVILDHTPQTPTLYPSQPPVAGPPREGATSVPHFYYPLVSHDLTLSHGLLLPRIPHVEHLVAMPISPDNVPVSNDNVPVSHDNSGLSFQPRI